MSHTKAITAVNLTDNTIAILAGNASGAKWEIYYVVDGLEMFSHVATGREAYQIASLAYGADLVDFAAQRKADAIHFGLAA